MKPLPKLTAVVHILSDRQAIEQTGIALDAGVGGVFLIDHNGGCDVLWTSYHRVRQEFPAAWIGLNFLGLQNRTPTRNSGE